MVLVKFRHFKKMSIGGGLSCLNSLTMALNMAENSAWGFITLLNSDLIVGKLSTNENYCQHWRILEINVSISHI